ncbi:MAG: lipopolysaccharide biosynthesis protein [Fluviicola sp.]
MGLVQKDAFRTMIISYLGIVLGYLNKGLLFVWFLKTEQIGLVNLIVTVGTLFAQLANMGSIFTVWKFFPFFKNADKRHHGFLPFILLIVLVGVLTFTVLYIGFSGQIQARYNEKSAMFNEYYYWILPIGISYVVFIVLESYLRSLYKNVVSVFAYEIVLRVVTTGLILLFILDWISFEQFVVWHSLIYIIPTLILLVYLIRINEFNLSYSSIQISKRFKRIIFQFSSFYYINSLGVVLVTSLDLMMLAEIIGLDETGVYSTVVFLSGALMVPYRSVVRVSAPLIADYWKHREMEKMKDLYQKVSSVSLVLGLGMFLMVWLNIDFLFSLLRPEYASGKWIFLMLMIGRLVDMYSGLSGAIFTTSKKYRYELVFTLILIGTVYACNLWLIPKWAGIGAAISTSIAFMAFNIGRLVFVWLIYRIHPFTRNQFIVIGLAAITFTAGYFTQGLINNKWIQMCFESILVMGLFVFPIYIFKLENETISYFQKALGFVKGKLIKK